MKVSIGKPTPWFTTTNIEEKYLEKRYGLYSFEISPKEYTQLDRAVIKVSDLTQTILNKTINRVFEKKQQKIRVHIDDWDIWSADVTLAHIALPLVEKLRDESQGFFEVDNEDVPEELRATELQIVHKEIDGTIDDNGVARWTYVLNEMIFAFEHIIDNDWEDEYYNVEWIDKKVFPKVECLDREGLVATHERITNGCRLFGKYFRALWD